MKPTIRIQTEDFDLGAEYQLLRQLACCCGRGGDLHRFGARPGKGQFY